MTLRTVFREQTRAQMKACVYLQGQAGLYLGISVLSVAQSIQKMLDHSKSEKLTRNLLTVLGQQASTHSQP